MNKSKIEWTTWTSNPLYADGPSGRGWFCEKVSPGCAHCYASTMNETAHWMGTGLEFVPGNRDRVRLHLNESELAEWSRKYRVGPKMGQPMHEGRCFAFDMTDLFGEWVPDEWLDKIFAAMALAPNLQFQILTKRPERMREYLTQDMVNVRWESAAAEMIHDWPGMFPAWLENVWLGVTVENQRWADHRIPILLDTPAAVRFVSAEPLLGPVNLRGYLGSPVRVVQIDRYNIGRDNERVERREWDCDGIDWLIIGGESGSRHRRFDLQWARDLIEQCGVTSCRPFMKQVGGSRPGNRLEDLPKDLQVREWPDA